MIKTETLSNGLIRTYSDESKMIKKVGTEETYCEAADLPTSGYTYIETDEIMECTDSDALRIVVGGVLMNEP